MKKEEYVKNKLSEMGYTIKGFADKIGMPNSTLRSMLVNIDGAAISNVFKVCQGLGITTDDLIAVEFDNYDVKKSPPQITDGEENENNEIIKKIKQLSDDNLLLLDDYLEYLLWRQDKATKITTILRAARSADHHGIEVVETTKDFSKMPRTKSKL